MLNEKTQIVLTKKTEIVDLAGEKAVMDFETGSYFILKGSANDIWEYIKDGISVGELIEVIMNDFDIDRETCLTQTSDFLYRLEEKEFLTLAPPC